MLLQQSFSKEVLEGERMPLILTAAQTDNPLPSQSPILVATTVPVIPVIAPPVVTVTPQTWLPFIVDDNEDTIGSGGFGNTGNTFPNTNSPVIPFQQRPNSIVVPAAVVNTLAPAPPTSDTLPQAAQIQDLNVNPTQPVNPISTIPTDSNPIPTRFPNSPPPPLAGLPSIRRASILFLLLLLLP
ncbi:hypothetical protein BC829DRAFT_491232 [Chytridium lagenaria]|nr:hypothetical protein BC829DRAFT_491232 [Chytridium lagenaria]